MCFCNLHVGFYPELEVPDVVRLRYQVSDVREARPYAERATCKTITKN